MRQLFSLRFLATLGALAALAGLLYVFLLGGDDTITEVVEAGPVPRRIELVSLVFSTAASPDFAMVDGEAQGTLDLVLDAQRTVHIVPGTPGEVTCETPQEPASCAVVADLLGDGVVWFSLVPLLGGDVEMPAIVSLQSDVATLENGWQVPYAPRLRRTCSRDFPSFRVFKDELGTNFTSIYDLVEQRLTEVVCTED